MGYELPDYMKQVVERMEETRSYAHSAFEDLLIAEGRRALQSFPEGVEVVAAMGSIFFSMNGVELPEDDPRIGDWVVTPEILDIDADKRFEFFVHEYQDLFGCTQGPWRFTRDGEVRYDW